MLLFGFLVGPNRVPDLEEFNWIEEFNEMSQTYINFASNIAGDGESIVIDDDIFPVKGFIPQYVKPNPKDQGKATEKTLVNQYGKSVKFDPDGDQVIDSN